MLNGGMQGCRGNRETKRKGRIQKFAIVAFHKNCKWNLLFILILRDRCVIHFVIVVVFFSFCKNWKKWNKWNKNIKALLNFNSFNVVASLKKGGLYVVFDILLQIWSKRQSLQHMPPAQTYWATDWLPDQINKWMTEWINVSSMPFWFITEVFF